MPHVRLNGVELYYEDTGTGVPIVFSHEFAGDYRSWEPQVRYFDRRYRCITYCHRGFPPSSVPTEPAAYSQDLLIEDLRGLVAHLGLDQAYFVGFSMGGNVVLNFALRYPELCRGIVVVGTGSGSTNHERFLDDIERTVKLLRDQGIQAFAQTYAEGPTRLPFKRKDPRGWQVFREQLLDHDPEGQALIMLGVLRTRPSIFALEDRLDRLGVPTLLMIGDEDEPCVDPAVFMKRHIPSAGLVVLPQCGHAINLEEPAGFNAAVLDFFSMVEANRWARRPRPTTSLLPVEDAQPMPAERAAQDALADTAPNPTDGTPAGVAVDAAQAVAADAAQTVVAAWHAALNAGDVERLLGLSTPDVEVGGPRGSGRGADLLRDWVARARITLAPKRVVARGATVVVEQAAAWHSAEGGEVTGREDVASVFVVRDGRVASVLRYADLAAALAAAGLDAP